MIVDLLPLLLQSIVFVVFIVIALIRTTYCDVCVCAAFRGFYVFLSTCVCMWAALLCILNFKFIVLSCQIYWHEIYWFSERSPSSENSNDRFHGGTKGITSPQSITQADRWKYAHRLKKISNSNIGRQSDRLASIHIADGAFAMCFLNRIFLHHTLFNMWRAFDQFNHWQR